MCRLQPGVEALPGAGGKFPGHEIFFPMKSVCNNALPRFRPIPAIRQTLVCFSKFDEKGKSLMIRKHFAGSVASAPALGVS
ncbi:hypothetical protein V2S84_20445, partial [Azotobacter chroococcum]|nr:hypothetical protein [Azotobacter chroococcum]